MTEGRKEQEVVEAPICVCPLKCSFSSASETAKGLWMQYTGTALHAFTGLVAHSGPSLS